MAGDIKSKYPAADTSEFSITTASLAASATLVAGRGTLAVSNTTSLDEDVLVTGKIAIQSHATIGRIEVRAYSHLSIASGTPTYGKNTGIDEAVTFDSRAQAVAHGPLLWSFVTDASVARTYWMPATSLRQAFGEIPAYFGLIVLNGHGGALSATEADCAFYYHRIQKQYT